MTPEEYLAKQKPSKHVTDRRSDPMNSEYAKADDLQAERYAQAFAGMTMAAAPTAGKPTRLSDVQGMMRAVMDGLERLTVEAAPRATVGDLPQPTTPDGCPGIRLDMSKAGAARRLPAVHNSGPQGPPLESVPLGYVKCEVDSKYEGGAYDGMTATEHGGATLLADRMGRARYILGCGHVPTVFNSATGKMESIASEFRCSIRPSSRSNEPMVFACTEVYVHPHYEAAVGSYRNDLSLTVLPEPVDISHAILRRDMRLHATDPRERLTYCGMGSVEKNGPVHDELHVGVMTATERALNHLTEMSPITDQPEQGFSGGPFYSDQDDQRGTWAGVFSHYTELDPSTDRRHSYMIPATFALPWADAMISWICEREGVA